MATKSTTKAKKTSSAAVVKRPVKSKKTPAVPEKTSPPKAASHPSTPPKSSNVFRLRRSHVLVLGGVVLAIAALYFLRSFIIAATVNGSPISRLSVLREAEKQQGQEVLNNLVTKKLIQQEAAKKNVSVSEEEINTELKRIEEDLKSRGQNLTEELQRVGWNQDDLRNDIELRKLVEKMVGNDIQVSDKEINDYIEQNKESFPADSKPEDLKKNVKEQLRQQKLSEKIQPWIENLQKNAKINYFVSY